MKRSCVLTAILALAFLALFIGGAPAASAEDPPPSPWFQATIDETSPADPTVAPVDDDCPVGVPCKVRTTVAIAPGDAVLPIASVTSNAFYVAHGGTVPNGIRVGTTGFATSLSISTVGPCETNAIPYASGTVLVDAAIDPQTTTRSPADLASPAHWPSQLNDELLRIATHVHSPALWARYVGVYEVRIGQLEYYVPINILVIRAPDGSYVSAYLVGDPSSRNPDGTMELGGPEIRLCSPFVFQTTIQGLALDLADPTDPAVYGLRVCLAPGPHPFAAIFIPLLPGGTPIVRVDAAACSGQLTDTDSDGVPDLIDFCDTQPEDPDGIKDRDGCPETDADQDGVLDAADNCPQVPNPGQVDSDGDSHGDACDPDDDNDSFPDRLERKLGSDPLSAASTPEHIVVPGTCDDSADNDGDGATDANDTGCRPFADFDSDGFPNVVEEHLGSNPADPASTPEHFILTPTCFDAADNDADGLTDTQDPGCFPFRDSDGDGFIDALEERLGSDPDDANSTPEHFLLAGTCTDGADNDLDDLTDAADDGCQISLDPDGDGYATPLELHLGSNPTDPASTPENIVFPETCTDGADNDGDGRTDFQDQGCLVLDVDGDHQLNQDDPDDDADGYVDATEAHVGTAPQQPCGNAGFPADLWSGGASANRIDLADVLSFVAPARRLGTNLDSLPGNGRWDLSPGRGIFTADLNIQDLLSVVTAQHPVVGGRAFGGPACQPGS